MFGFFFLYQTTNHKVQAIVAALTVQVFFLTFTCCLLWPSIKPSYGFQKQRKGHFIPTEDSFSSLQSAILHSGGRRQFEETWARSASWRQSGVLSTRHLLRATRDPLNNMLRAARRLAHAGCRCIFWSAGLVFRRLLPAQLFLDDWYSPPRRMRISLRN